MKNANKRNETNFNALSRRNEGRLTISNIHDQWIKEGWRQYFYETPISNDNVKTREEDKRYPD